MGIVDLGKALMPPGDPVTTWRWTVGMTVFALVVVVGLHMTGLMPGNTGYASAAQLDLLRIDRIEEKIIDARRRQCTAMADRNEKAKSFYFKNLSKERRAFFDITGREYDLPGCDEI